MSAIAITNWELILYQPLIRYKIIEFLNYNPLPKPFPVKLCYYHFVLDMNQKRFEKLVGFKFDTIFSWETSKFIPTTSSVKKFNISFISIHNKSIKIYAPIFKSLFEYIYKVYHILAFFLFAVTMLYKKRRYTYNPC